MPLPDDELALNEITANRVTNLRQAKRLRDELDKSILMVTANGALQLPPFIVKELAQAAGTIHDLTYRAVGDKNLQRNPSDGGGNVTQVVLNFPTQLQTPRGQQLAKPPPLPIDV